MKQSAVLLVLLLAILPHARAVDTEYQASLKALHERFDFLDTKRNDYRKPKPLLSAEEEAERFRLLGQLSEEDPVWALAQQIQADLQILATESTSLPDLTVAESLKEILAIANGIDQQATSRAQAQEFADSLRRFVARRDSDGAESWAKLR